MPFESREIVFFICPVCKKEYPILKGLAENSIFSCNQESCNGQEVYIGQLSGGKTRGETPLLAPLEEGLSVSSQPGLAEPANEIRRARQAPVITVSSAILINIALILTFIVLFYLLPIGLQKCS